MKMPRYFYKTYKNRFLVLVSLLLFITGAAKASEINSTFPLSVEDFRGKTLTFENSPKRVVCLIESALSGIFMLGAQDRLVGISTNIYSSGVFDYYAAMASNIYKKELPVPGNWDFVNIESVVSLSPDLVIIWAHQTEAIDALEERGLKVFGVFIRNFDDIYLEMERFGKIFDKSQRARTLVDETQKAIAHFQKKLAAVSAAYPASVYFMWAQGDLETSGKHSTVNDLIAMAGAKNICGHIEQEHLVINIENILSWNPDVIVMWHNAAKDPDDILAYPMWQSVNAVKNRRVYELPEVFACDFWTLKFQYAVKAMAKWCYPDEMAALDLETEKLRMYELLYNDTLETVKK